MPKDFSLYRAGMESFLEGEGENQVKRRSQRKSKLTREDRKCKGPVAGLSVTISGAIRKPP